MARTLQITRMIGGKVIPWFPTMILNYLSASPQIRVHIKDIFLTGVVVPIPMTALLNLIGSCRIYSGVPVLKASILNFQVSNITLFGKWRSLIFTIFYMYSNGDVLILTLENLVYKYHLVNFQYYL